MSISKKQEVLKVFTNHSFRLVAVSSSLNLNKLLWSINSVCGLNLVKNPELESALSVAAFTDRHSLHKVIISIFPNRQSEGFLFRQLLNVDFIIEINGAFPKPDFEHFLRQIKGIEGVMAVIEVNPNSIKRKEPFCPE